MVDVSYRLKNYFLGAIILKQTSTGNRGWTGQKIQVQERSKAGSRADIFGLDFPPSIILITTKLTSSSVLYTILHLDGIRRRLFLLHLNPKSASPRRTLREEDDLFPDVITHVLCGETCGYLPAFLSFATCSNTMCCPAFAFYFCSLSRKCYEATRIDVSCRLG